MPKMTVAQLRELIADLPDETEVRLATQPNYPFENWITGVNLVHPDAEDLIQIAGSLSAGDLTPEEEAEARSQHNELMAKPEILYILEGGQIGYASRELWEI